MIPAPLSRRTDQSLTRMPLRIGKHRLFRLVLPFVAVILFQAFLAGVSLEVLSSVRAYVGGESLWSKGQKVTRWSAKLPISRPPMMDSLAAATTPPTFPG
jgi:hypothetical protein